MFFTKEVHRHLHCGRGKVITYTRDIYFFKKKIGKLSLLVLEPRGSIGPHRHVEHSEIYFTLNSKVFFRENRKSRFINRCEKGDMHSAQNSNGYKKAIILAYKY